MRPHSKQRRNFTGKSKERQFKEDIKDNIAFLAGSEYSDVNENENASNFDKFVEKAFKLYNRPKHRENALSLLNNNLSNIGLKNFYKVAEFLKKNEKQDSEIELSSFRLYEEHKKLTNEDFGIREIIQQYLQRKLKQDADAHISFFELGNGRYLINSHKLDKGRVISNNDFPKKQGFIKLKIVEDGVEYALRIDMLKQKNRFKRLDPEEPDKEYRVTIKPLFNQNN